MTDIRPAKIEDKATWPFEAPDHTFIFAAIDIVGRFALPDQWTGKEFWPGYIQYPYPEPKGPIDDAGQVTRSAAIVYLRRYGDDTHKEITEANLTADLWTKAGSLYPRYAADRQAARQRLATARAKLGEMCRDGTLIAAVRSEYDGSFTRIDQRRWTLEKHKDWLDKGEGRECDTCGWQGREREYIFVENEGLRKLQDDRTAALLRCSELMREAANVPNPNEGKLAEWLESHRYIAALPGIIRDTLPTIIGAAMARPALGRPTREAVEDYFVHCVKKVWVDHGKSDDWVASAGAFRDICQMKWRVDCNAVASAVWDGNAPDSWRKTGRPPATRKLPAAIFAEAEKIAAA